MISSIFIGTPPRKGKKKAVCCVLPLLMIRRWSQRVSFNVIDTERQDWARGGAQLKQFVQQEAHARCRTVLEAVDPDWCPGWPVE